MLIQFLALLLNVTKRKSTYRVATNMQTVLALVKYFSL
jgi:hypothetical protein